MAVAVIKASVTDGSGSLALSYKEESLAAGAQMKLLLCSHLLSSAF